MPPLSNPENTLARKKAFFAIYLLAFLTAFHLALPIYIESSFIEGVLGRFDIQDVGRFVGIVYAAASFITLLTFLNISKILRRVGNYHLAFGFIIFEIVSLFGLSLSQTLPPPYLIFLFIVHLVVVNIISFNLDLFLESVSDDSSTGTVRGAFMTITNVSFVVAPLVAGLVLTNGDIGKIFLLAAFVLIPTLLLLSIKFRAYKDPEYDKVSFREAFKQILQRKNIRKIMACNFILRFFYAWMTIYTPIYLHQSMGIPFSQIIGVIMPIALLPFILFEFALGKIADRTLGEKELLTAGFIIAALATTSLSFIVSSNIFVWAVLLFMTRVGASFIEIMSETYFFKKIDATDTHLMGYYRNVQPLAYIIAPLIGTGFLFLIDSATFANTGLEFKHLFVILGVILLSGTYFSLTLKDTR